MSADKDFEMIVEDPWLVSGAGDLLGWGPPRLIRSLDIALIFGVILALSENLSKLSFSTLFSCPLTTDYMERRAKAIHAKKESTFLKITLPYLETKLGSCFQNSRYSYLAPKIPL